MHMRHATLCSVAVQGRLGLAGETRGGQGSRNRDKGGQQRRHSIKLAPEREKEGRPKRQKQGVTGGRGRAAKAEGTVLRCMEEQPRAAHVMGYRKGVRAHACGEACMTRRHIIGHFVSCRGSGTAFRRAQQFPFRVCCHARRVTPQLGRQAWRLGSSSVAQLSPEEPRGCRQPRGLPRSSGCG